VKDGQQLFQVLRNGANKNLGYILTRHENEFDYTSESSRMLTQMSCSRFEHATDDGLEKRDANRIVDSQPTISICILPSGTAKKEGVCYV
jgi:hypothetical protein